MREKLVKKKENLAILLEFLISAGLGIYFHWVLHYEQAAYIVFGIGLLLSLSTYLLSKELSHFSELLSDNYQHAHKINFSLTRIKNPQCWSKAQEILETTEKALNILQQGYLPLNETEFFLETAKVLDQSKYRVKAVDPIKIDWDNRGALLNYYQTNRDAIKRGVKINRIFVISKQKSKDPKILNLFETQVRDGINVRVAYIEELPFRNETNFDFAIFDEKEVIEWEGLAGNYYGKKTSVPAEIVKYLHLFELIEHHARPVKLENEEGVALLNNNVLSPLPA